MKKISKDEAQERLADNNQRSLFILEYNHFNDDGNGNLYKRFVKQMLDTARDGDLVSDALYLAINIDYYSAAFFDRVVNDLFRRRNFLSRLACFDYIHNYKDKKVNQFEDVCWKLLKSSSNDMKVLAAAALVKIDRSLLNLTMKILQGFRVPTMFYKVFNLFKQDGIKFSRHEKKALEALVVGKNFSNSVRKELLYILSQFPES